MNLWSEKSRTCPVCRQVFTFIRSETFTKYIDPQKRLQIEEEPTEEELIFQSLDYDEQLDQDNADENDLLVHEPAHKSEWFLDDENIDFFLEDILTALSFLSLEEHLYDLDLLKPKTDFILGTMYQQSSHRQRKLAHIIKTWWLRYLQARQGRRKCTHCRGFLHKTSKCIYASLSDPVVSRRQQESLQQQLRAYVYFKMKSHT
jgi:hypothetical protein